MKIGIDIDGVILDFEKLLRAYVELYDLVELNKNGVVNEEKYMFQDRYDWTEEETNGFIDKYFIYATKQSPLLPCAKEVLNYLKQEGSEFIIITARGGILPQMKDEAEKIFDRENLKFDKYYWKTSDKLEVCLKENIDIMIDDNPNICKNLSENKIMTLYLRDKDVEELDENEYLKEVSNWGEIYRFIKRKYCQ